VVRQAAVVMDITSSANDDVVLCVQVDGAGTWYVTGGCPMTTQFGRECVPGEAVLTGLSPGQHVFYMGWHCISGNTMEIDAGTRTASQLGTWQSVGQ
jgi:hypothetical protein